MKTMLGFRARMLCCTFLLGAGIVAKAGVLPGMGQLSGQVAGVPADLLTTVYALHTEKNVGYMVYVVDGRYRAVNLFPGR
jgi:hypothetical protein